MKADTRHTDSAASRPLPQWLITQKEASCTVPPPEPEPRKDHSLYISFTFTALFVLLAVVVLSVYVKRKFRKNQI